MASSNSPLVSSPSSINDLQQWVININETFENHFLVDTDLGFCIFQVSQALITEKPESYLPQHTGLGPIHHFRTQIYSKQQQLKLITAKRVLKANQIAPDFKKVIRENLKKLVPQARCCYDLHFDMDDDTLAWVFTLDGLFLLDVILKATEGSSSESLGDVMMLENQIPFVMLVDLLNSLKVVPAAGHPDNSSPSINRIHLDRSKSDNEIFATESSSKTTTVDASVYLDSSHSKDVANATLLESNSTTGAVFFQYEGMTVDASDHLGSSSTKLDDPDGYVVATVKVDPLDHLVSSHSNNGVYATLSESNSTTVDASNGCGMTTGAVSFGYEGMTEDASVHLDSSSTKSDELDGCVIATSMVDPLDDLFRSQSNYTADHATWQYSRITSVPAVEITSVQINTDWDDLNEITTEDISGGSQNLLLKFCETRSPLQFSTPITSQLDVSSYSRFHLLDCMYHLIADKYVPPVLWHRVGAGMAHDIRLEDVEKVVKLAGGLFPAANVVLQPILVVLKLPWDKIAILYKKMVAENPTALEIDIPSVSRLSRVGKIEFCKALKGIRDIDFIESTLKFYLPELDLKSDTEVILRNLVAYEGLMFKKGTISDLVLTEYVDLMCGIVDGVEDVKILREKNIIKGELTDGDIVKLFNGIAKSNVETDATKSKLQKSIAKVNKHYGNEPKVKAYRLIKKWFLASWKIFVIVLPLLTLLLTIVTGVCQVYECKGHFGLGDTRMFLTYATAQNNLLSDM